MKVFDAGKTRMIGLPYHNGEKTMTIVKPFSSDTGSSRADGRTDRFAILISRVSMLTHDKNSRVRRSHMLKPTVQQYEQCSILRMEIKHVAAYYFLRTMWRVDLRGLYAKVHETCITCRATICA